ncbi:MAG: histidine kinase dimerization/phosphoacceptor domain -containing protein [Balneolaceae bacterium]|nr:histidine kinase dimerization/phosphoacceptor domain -containing protein [Balneolaceae bacterium]
MSDKPRMTDAATKAKAALRVIAGTPAGEVAAELDVEPGRVERWVEKLRRDAPATFEGNTSDAYRSLLDSITRNVQEAVLRSTPEEGLIYVNDAFLKMFGYQSKEEVLNTQPEKFYAESEERWDLVKEMREKGRISNAEVRFRRRDGSEFWGLENSILVEVDGRIYIDGIVHDITERKRFEKRIQESLREKDVMLGEIHHRVKNNLAVISGLLYLQEERSGDRTASNLLRQSRSRINSMGIVHEMLYKNRTFSSIDPVECVEELVAYIRSDLDLVGKGMQVKVEGGDMQLDMNTAVPFALILHELVSNAFKYASRGEDEEPGLLEISFSKEGDHYRMVIGDNGPGIPDGVLDNLEHACSLGLFLVHTLVNQLNGDMDVEVDEGTRFTITFPG